MSECLIHTSKGQITQISGSKTTVAKITAWAKSKGYDLLTEQVIIEYAKEHGYIVHRIEQDIEEKVH